MKIDRLLLFIVRLAFLGIAQAQLCSYTLVPVRPILSCSTCFTLDVYNPPYFCTAWIQYFTSDTSDVIPSTSLLQLYYGASCRNYDVCQQGSDACTAGFALTSGTFFLVPANTPTYTMSVGDSLAQCASTGSWNALEVTITSTSSSNCELLASLGANATNFTAPTTTTTTTTRSSSTTSRTSTTKSSTSSSTSTTRSSSTSPVTTTFAKTSSSPITTSTSTAKSSSSTSSSTSPVTTSFAKISSSPITTSTSTARSSSSTSSSTSPVTTSFAKTSSSPITTSTSTARSSSSTSSTSTTSSSSSTSSTSTSTARSTSTTSSSTSPVTTSFAKISSSPITTSTSSTSTTRSSSTTSSSTSPVTTSFAKTSSSPITTSTSTARSSSSTSSSTSPVTTSFAKTSSSPITTSTSSTSTTRSSSSTSSSTSSVSSTSTATSPMTTSTSPSTSTTSRYGNSSFSNTSILANIGKTLTTSKLSSSGSVFVPTSSVNFQVTSFQDSTKTYSASTTGFTNYTTQPQNISIVLQTLQQAIDALNSTLNTSQALEQSGIVLQQVDSLLGFGTAGSSQTVQAGLNVVLNALSNSLLAASSGNASLTISTPKIAVGVAVLPALSYNYKSSVSFSVQETSGILDSCSVSFTGPAKSASGSVSVPMSVIARSVRGAAARLGFLAFANASQFAATSGGQLVGSGLLSAAILGVTVRDAEQPISLQFQVDTLPDGNYTAQCSFWDYNAQQWSSQGCWLASAAPAQLNNASLQCLCNHLTDFALLFNVYQYNLSALSAEENYQLTVASYVGCVVSVLCLVVTIALCTSIRSVRTHVSGQLLISQSVALIGLNAFFIVNAALATLVDVRGCLALAALQHYFLLAAFCWTVVQSAYLYIKLVVVFSEYMPKFILKVSFAAWGIPLLPVIIQLALQDIYGSYQNQICWFKNILAFQLSVVLPISLILLINFMVYAFTMHKITVITQRQLKRRWLQQANTPQNYSSVEGQTVKCHNIYTSPKMSSSDITITKKDSTGLTNTEFADDSRRGSKESNTYTPVMPLGSNEERSNPKSAELNLPTSPHIWQVRRQDSNATSNVNLVIQAAEANQGVVAKTQLKFGAGLFFLLGLTWVFAFFTFGSTGWIFAILFAVLNGLQGVFILFYCCLKGEVKKWVSKHFLLRTPSSKPSSETARGLGQTAPKANVAAISSPDESSGSQTPSSVFGSGVSSWPDPHVRGPIVQQNRPKAPLQTLFATPDDGGVVKGLSYVKKDSTYSNSTQSTNVSRNTSLSSSQNNKS